MTDKTPGGLHVHIRSSPEDWRSFTAAAKAAEDGLHRMKVHMEMVGKTVAKVAWEVEDTEKNGKLVPGIPWVRNTGGIGSMSGKAGRGDDAIRAVTIATGGDVMEVAGEFSVIQHEFWIEASRAKRVYKSKLAKYGVSIRESISREVMDKMMAECGWAWVPTMAVGSSDRMHLRYDELPEEAMAGSVVMRLSSDEYVAVVKGVAHHPADPSRGGTRLVYGYYCPGGLDWLRNVGRQL